jgi:hypothetical protein
MTELLSFDENGVQFAWDSTSISNYARCPRYYKFVNIEGWQPVDKSVHLLFGGWYAKALEEYYVLTCKQDFTSEEALREVVRRALIRTWVFPHEEEIEFEEGLFSPGMPPLRGEPGPWQSLHNAKTRETLIRSIVWYLTEFGPNDNTDVVTVDDQPAVELSFSIPLTDAIMYCGHIDRLVEFGGDVYAMDQKTSGATISKNFFKGFDPDFQMSGYSFAGSILFGQAISGVIIDAAQIAVGFTEFSRGFVHKAKPNLEEWRENVIALIERAQEDTRKDTFLPNYTACDKYGGCTFRKVCSRIPQHRKNALAADFIQAPRWDPLKQR